MAIMDGSTGGSEMKTCFTIQLSVCVCVCV